MIVFFIFILSIILLRLAELWRSGRNEKWLRAHGAIEYGKGHYPIIVVLHVLFIASIIVEFLVFGGKIDVYFLAAFITLALFKIWVISSLGRYWNTKIFRVPGAVFIKKGPYKYFKHPNYFIVACEIAVIPLVFHLYYTAIIFSLLNATILSIRIKEEEIVWKG